MPVLSCETRLFSWAGPVRGLHLCLTELLLCFWLLLSSAVLQVLQVMKQKQENQKPHSKSVLETCFWETEEGGWVGAWSGTVNAREVAWRNISDQRSEAQSPGNNPLFCFATVTLQTRGEDDGLRERHCRSKGCLHFYIYFSSLELYWLISPWSQ